jgi:primosomal protein N'
VQVKVIPYDENMKLYTVIPIARGMGKETLSYFGSDGIETGALVSIPLRKKEGYGIVIGEEDVKKAKAQIKSSAFTLRKITKVGSKKFLSKKFLDAALETARFHASTTGAVLLHLLPEALLENATKVGLVEDTKPETIRSESLLVQGEYEDRFAHYKGFIRGQFARRSSVFFCLPTIENIRQAKEILQKGIAEYTVVLHSSLSKKELSEALQIIKEEKHPVLIIATAPFLSVPRKDIGSIVLEKENSRVYKTQSRPYIDLRIFVEKFARAKNIPILRGDLLLSIETLWKWKNDEYGEFSPLKMRALSGAHNVLIDMRKKAVGLEDGSPNDDDPEKFRVLSPALEALIDKNHADSERLFIWSARKGLSPTTVCGDCGAIVICNRCSAPVTLYSGRKGEENFFMCNKCGVTRSAAEKCRFCDSWKLATLGIGIERVEEEITKKFPHVKVFRLDKDAAKTEKKAHEILSRFYATPGSILLGTELALFYLTENIENMAVASIDSLFALPDFRISEKIIYSLLLMRSRAEKVFLIQTRNASDPLFEYALKGNIIDFYKQEIADRETFGYPPFSIFIKLSVEGKGVSVETAAENIKKLLVDYEPKIYKSFAPSRRGNNVYHVLISRKPKEWPDDVLLQILLSLPPSVGIRVDPESLL